MRKWRLKYQRRRYYPQNPGVENDYGIWSICPPAVGSAAGNHKAQVQTSVYRRELPMPAGYSVPVMSIMLV